MITAVFGRPHRVIGFGEDIFASRHFSHPARPTAAFAAAMTGVMHEYPPAHPVVFDVANYAPEIMGLVCFCPLSHLVKNIKAHDSDPGA